MFMHLYLIPFSCALIANHYVAYLTLSQLNHAMLPIFCEQKYLLTSKFHSISKKYDRVVSSIYGTQGPVLKRTQNWERGQRFSFISLKPLFDLRAPLKLVASALGQTNELYLLSSKDGERHTKCLTLRLREIQPPTQQQLQAVVKTGNREVRTTFSKEIENMLMGNTWHLWQGAFIIPV